MTLSQSAILKKDREARYNARIKRTLDELVPISEKITLLVHASANRAALKGLKMGMRLEEAKRSMGDRTRTGSSGYFNNIVLKNLHRSMTFYGAFTPEQFTPVHFINDRLSGWGWKSLQLLKEGKRLGEDCQSKLLEAQRLPKKLFGV